MNEFELLPVRTKVLCVLIAALGLFFLAAWTRYFIKRRKFLRRNAAGLEVFSSYRKAWWITQVEALIYGAAAKAQPICLLAVLACIVLLVLPYLTTK